MTTAAAYFVRETETRFRPTPHVGGGWNTSEQHIAPSIGLLAHEIEHDHHRRRPDEPLLLSRVTCDILGVFAIEPVDVTVSVIRPGRTIELVEARLDHDGRTAATLRAWYTQPQDTAHLVGTDLPPIPSVDELPEWHMGGTWGGGFVGSLEVRKRRLSPGRAVAWVRTDLELIAGEQVSPTAHMLGLIDVANGLASRISSGEAAFPNLDLTAHLTRAPEGDWTGFETDATFGPTGIGLTHSVIHDQHGPLGTVAQSLTVRPR